MAFWYLPLSLAMFCSKIQIAANIHFCDADSIEILDKRIFTIIHCKNDLRNCSPSMLNLKMNKVFSQCTKGISYTKDILFTLIRFFRKLVTRANFFFLQKSFSYEELAHLPIKILSAKKIAPSAYQIFDWCALLFPS